ncbi:sentrin-specific protease 1-like [Olea europaea subsp. europaea]|uniref:Sentrin-specific protease 1-like n=1 Tax=Olea europaea subsp. europaea TaxID=158383 RepID=A0A8S0UI30_OLEEU|nr:sentrin-specific protease 1-like [Olea europaea subsp. europaea]
MNWMADEQPFAAKLEGADCFANVDIVICDLEPSKTEMAMPYMNNVQYQKSIQPDLLSENRRKNRTKKSAGNASASGKSVTLLTDSSMGQPNVSNDNDDFVDHAPRRQDTPPGEKSPIDEAPSATHNSLDEPHTHMPQWVDEEIMRQFSEKAKDRGTVVHGVGDKGTHVTRGFDKTDEHMDACFYYIRQLAKHCKNLHFRATTTNSWFQHKIKDIYSAFMKDPQVLMSELSLVNVITGHSLPLSTPWADVDHVFMSMLPINKAHWMLGVLQFRSHSLTVFNSAGKTYHNWKVLEGIEPYVKILPALMNALGISKKDPDYDGPGSKELKVYIDSTLPQQTNGHNCGVFVILYALYIIRDERCSIPHRFDINKCRLGIAVLLCKYREMYVKHAKQGLMEDGMVVE